MRSEVVAPDAAVNERNKFVPTRLFTALKETLRPFVHPHKLFEATSKAESAATSNDVTPFLNGDWDGLEMWLDAGDGEVQPGFTPQQIIRAMQGSGWRPPAGVIETVEELASLGDRSIILDTDDVTYRLNPWDVDREPRWYPFDGNSAYARDFGVQAGDISFPVTVLWESGDPR